MSNITSIRNNLWEIELTIDILMSYKDAIKNLRGFIDRNENSFNRNIIDKNVIFEQGVEKNIHTISSNVFIKTYSANPDESHYRNFVLTGYKISTTDEAPV